MIKYVRTTNVPETCRYLTNGKTYKIVKDCGHYLEIYNDHGINNCICIDSCAHLDGKSWEIVKGEK